MAEQLKAVISQGGDSISLGSGGDFGLLEYEGFEASEYTISFDSNAQLDGGTVAGKKVEPRPIKLVGEYLRVDKSDRMRQRLIKLFNPKKTGELTVTFGNVSRKIQYEVEAFKVDEQNIFRPLRFTANLICPSPYWLDTETFAKNMAGVRKLLAFPFIIPKQRGVVMSYREMQQEAVIVNKGNREVGLNVTFEAKRGSVLNPALYNLSKKQYLRMELEMQEGDVLTICTIPGKKRVEWNGANAIQYIDRGSVFFGIAPGETVIKYDADDNKQNLDVYPRYTPEYLGV